MRDPWLSGFLPGSFIRV